MDKFLENLMIRYLAAKNKGFVTLENCGSVRAIFLDEGEVGYTFKDKGIQQYGFRKGFIDFLLDLEITDKNIKEAQVLVKDWEYNVKQVG